MHVGLDAARALEGAVEHHIQHGGLFSVAT